MTYLSSQFDHARYEELCALATAGALTASESEDLFTHLDQCSDCRKYFAEYQSLANEGMPLLIDLHKETPESAGFDDKKALGRLLENARKIPPDEPVPTLLPSRFIPRPVWQSLTAASLLIGVVFASYRFGQLNHRSSVELRTRPLQPADVNRDDQSLRLRLQTAERREEELEILAAQRNTDLEQLRAEDRSAQERLDRLTTSLAASELETASQVKVITEQRDVSVARAQEMEQQSRNTQEELGTLRAQHKQDLARISSLENQVGGLAVALNEQKNRSKDDEQYLASDKDIRDLIGARNLYIADIMDVREDGSSRKPFGRVFYTKTKSLIFYAYDLDRQPGVKKASTFHVWGRAGADDRKPINLGVLYLDSETNRRWTLRVDNPEQLARLDAVFVTIEPREQMDKPTGKPFLYASLRREPNHP